MSRFTITLGDDTTTKLDAWAERLGQNRSTLVEIAVNWWLYAAENPPNTELVQNAPRLVQIAPEVGADCTKSTNQHETQPVTEPRKRIRPKILPTDTDEIIAVLSEIEAIPDADPNDLDLTTTYALRKAEIARRVAALRAAQPCNKPQVAENTPLTARPVPET